MKTQKDYEQIRGILQSQERVMDEAWETAKKMQSQALERFKQKEAEKKAAGLEEKAKK